MMRLSVRLLLVIGILGGVYATESTNTTFIATNEWQEIPEGQAIPAGLHVRINLETHKKEAKLLDETKDESGNNALTAQDINNADDGTDIKKEKILLSDALKSIKKDGVSLKYTPEELKRIKHDFEKQQNFDGYHKKMLDFQLDTEIIHKLIIELANVTSMKQENDFVPVGDLIKQQEHILDTFNDMLHQIDNSQFFVSQGGLELLLPIVANGTLSLRVKAMRVLGVLTQNNLNVQKEVLKQNFGTYLLKVLTTSTNTEELSTALYAFGSLIRKFPAAQRSLLPSLGMQALCGVLSNEVELKVKARVVNIISDILNEYNYMLSTTAEENTIIVNEYKSLELLDWLRFNQFCKSVEETFFKDALGLLKQPDLLQYFLEAMENAFQICKIEWASATRLHQTLSIMNEELAEENDDYLQEIKTEISGLLDLLLSQKQRHIEL